MLTGGRGRSFFLLGDAFLLFFGFVFEADEFENGNFGIVADTVTRVDDAGVAAGTIGVLGRDVREESYCGRRLEQERSSLAARLERVTLAECDDFLGQWARSLGARQRSSDAAVFEKIGDQRAEYGAAVAWVFA